ncbi:MAG TPA: hypothetical protein VMD30_04365 [Tepidisphaeraceae bacterium]|nr:hypothetical protein [Tepidisphaeraceae bacterium]
MNDSNRIRLIALFATFLLQVVISIAVDVVGERKYGDAFLGVSVVVQMTILYVQAWRFWAKSSRRMRGVPAMA